MSYYDKTLVESTDNTALVEDNWEDMAHSLALKLQSYADLTGNTLGTGVLKRYAALASREAQQPAGEK